MASSVEQIVNEALIAIGYRKRIGDINEGSEASIAALELYGQTRDEILRAQDWPFARAAGVALTLLKGPPPPGGYNPGQPWSNIYPSPPWLYEYAYPSDCLDLLALRGPPRMLPVLDPKPQVWRIDNDLNPLVSGNPPVASGPAQKVILAHVKGALATYRRQVTNPLLFEPGFTATLIEALGKKLMPILMPGSAQQEQARAQEVGVVAQLADQHRG